MTTSQPLRIDAYDGTYRVPSLDGVHGRVRLVGKLATRDVVIDDGQVTVTPEEGAADCTLTCFEPYDVNRLVTGELNPIIAMLQGRVELQGDRMLAIAIAGSMPQLREPLSDKR